MADSNELTTRSDIMGMTQSKFDAATAINIYLVIFSIVIAAASYMWL